MPRKTFLGDMAAGRSEILPEEWEAELSQLQDEVAPFSYEQVQQINPEELRADPEDLYAPFDH